MATVKAINTEVLERVADYLQEYIDTDLDTATHKDVVDCITSVLELAAQLPTIRNMVDFATWHAVDGMSPAMDPDELLENAIDDIDANVLYVKQKTRVDRARKILELPVETGWVVKK